MKKDSVHSVVPTTQQYIAIRNGCLPPNGSEVAGRIIRNCIFSNWDDAKIFLQGPDSQYEICNAIEDAVQFAFRQYLGNNMKTSQDGQGAKGSSAEYAHPANDNVGKENTCCVSSVMKKNKEQPPEDLLMSTALRMRAISEPIDPSASLQSCDVEKVITGNNDNVNISTTSSSSQKANSSTSSINDEALTVYGVPAVSLYGGNEINQPPKKKPRKQKEVDENSQAESVLRWEEQFVALKEYCNEHGSDTNLRKNNYRLWRWAARQKQQYKELQTKGKSRLTASQIQRLNDIGFKFLPRGNYVGWDQRMKTLFEFKREHGHVRVPTSHPVLGEWVRSQRKQYQQVIKNDPKCKMTQERINQLKDVGFDFVAGKTGKAKKADGKFDGRVAPKPWDERFEQLLEFKANHGHTIVPQKYPILGTWVHSQRMDYRKLLKGQKSKITNDKVAKLIEIGFVFDASGIKTDMTKEDINNCHSENEGDGTVYDEL